MSFAVFILYLLCTYLRPFEAIAPELNAFRPMLILLALSLALGVGRAVTRWEVGARAVHFWLLAMLVFAIGMSQVANQWAGGALASIADFSASAMLMILCFLNLTSTKRVQVTCGAIACSVILLAGLGAYSFHTGFMAEELVIKVNAYGEGEEESIEPVETGSIPAQETSGRYFYRLRSLGFLNDPNDFAQIMAMVLPLLWLTYAPDRWWRNLFTIGVPSAILGYAIYLTQSRGALLGVMAVLLLLVHRALGTFRTLALAGIAVALLGAISFGGRELSSKEESAALRIDAWYAGWNMLKAKPVFGVGYGNFLDYNVLTAHNSFVLCFSELGLLGYFAWLGMIVLAFAELNRAIRLTPQDAPEQKVAVILRAALIAFLVCAWFLSRTYQPGLYVLLALCMSAWICARKKVARTTPQVIDEVIPWAKATVIAMIISIATVYAFIAAQRLGG